MKSLKIWPALWERPLNNKINWSRLILSFQRLNFNSTKIAERMSVAITFGYIRMWIWLLRNEPIAQCVRHIWAQHQRPKTKFVCIQYYVSPIAASAIRSITVANLRKARTVVSCIVVGVAKAAKYIAVPNAHLYFVRSAFWWISPAPWWMTSQKMTTGNVLIVRRGLCGHCGPNIGRWSITLKNKKSKKYYCILSLMFVQSTQLRLAF